MTPHDAISAAGAAIEAVVDDYKIDATHVAACAAYRTAVGPIFDSGQILEMIRTIVEKSTIIRFVSNRAARSISRAAPLMQFIVDDNAAFAKYGDTALSQFDLQQLKATTDANLIVKYKAAVVFEEFCRELSGAMSEAIQPAWAEAKDILKGLMDADRVLTMLISNIFGISISDEVRPLGERVVFVRLMR